KGQWPCWMHIGDLECVKAQMRLQETRRSINSQALCRCEKFCRHTIGRKKAEIAPARFARFIFGNCGSEFAKILAPAQTCRDIQDAALLRLQGLARNQLISQRDFLSFIGVFSSCTKLFLSRTCAEFCL